MFAMSHGTSTQHVFSDLNRTAETIEQAFEGGADSVLVSPGFARDAIDVFVAHPDKGLVLKASATAYERLPRETAIATAEDALRVGADAVGILMQLTPSVEAQVIGMVAEFGAACDRVQVPLVVEAELPGTYGDQSWYPEDITAYLRRSCRMAQELGADVIKTNWPGSAESWTEISAGVTLPLIVAGGAQAEEHTFLAMLAEAMESGAAGASVGRNIFQSPDPRAITRRIAEIVHSGLASAPPVKAAVG
jgi:fructose-bisphosphate aldolase/2-amino-3,7-dideoxy-D-threo-hept-6-ulosonate synthase